MAVKLECLTRLLHSLTHYYQLKEADLVYSELAEYVWNQGVTSSTFPHLAYILSEFSYYHYMKVCIQSR